MDKYEYKVRLEEINTLIAERDFEEAAIIADSIDWKRVKSVKTLCMISDIYKYVQRLDDAKEILLLAYERHPSGKSIVFSLCELCIKMNQTVQAIEYYKEFVQLAPGDSGRYILQYKLYVTQDVSLEERIEVLNQLKEHERIEKWIYELAYLYHRIGDKDKCIEECDELILWFGEGKYVTKAMELKMQHAPLTPTQQAKYDTKENTASLAPLDEADLEEAEPQAVEQNANYEADLASAPTVNLAVSELEGLQVKTDVGEYNTINLQKELADSMKDMWEVTSDNLIRPVSTSLEPGAELTASDATTTAYTHVEEQSVKTEENSQETEISFENSEINNTGEIVMAQLEEVTPEGETKVVTPVPDDDGQMGFVETDLTATKVLQEIRDQKKEESTSTPIITESTYEVGFSDGKFERYLGMEYDGQISMVVPNESHVIEKQITGQLRIEDILAEWERKKKEEEEKRAEEVKQLVLSHTGNILIDFDVAVRDGLLEKLEKEPDDGSPITEYLPPEEEEVYAEEPETVEEIEEIEEPEEVTEGQEEYFEEETIEAPQEEMTFEEELNQEEEILEEVQEEVSEETTEEPQEEALEEVTEELQEETLEEVTEEPQEEAPEEVTEEIQEEVTEEPVRETEEDTQPKETVEETSEEKEASKEEEPSEPEEEKQAVRDLTREERELYAAYIQNSKMQAQLVNAVDSVSLAPYTGNLIITGDEGMDPITLGKNMMKEIQTIDSNFSGKIAKISGNSLNLKEPEEVVNRIANGALIIENAGRMSFETSEKLYKALQKENGGIIVVITGSKKSIAKMLEACPKLKESFSAQIDLEALDNDTLVRFARQYALSQEYSIDEMGLLALHTKISDNQTSDHAVTLVEVKNMIADAINSANRRNLGHFFDVLFGKRYDEEDMIILKEKDFA